MYIFISHSSKNSGTAEDICQLIESNGHQCFLAPRDIRSGYEYAEEIINGMDRSDAMVLLLSKEANDSPHVLREVERAVSKKIPVIVYKIENVDLSKSMEYFLMSHQWVSAKPNIDHSAVLKCINDLAAANGKEDSIPSTPAPAEDKTKKKISTKAIITTVVLFIAGLIIGLGCWAAVKIADSTVGDVESADSLEITENNDDNDANISFGDSDTSGSEQAAALEGDLNEILLGETITLGTYNGQPIEWRFIHISDDNTKAVVIADKILTMKCYDSAEGGKYNVYEGESYWNVSSEELDADLDRLLRGNNSWECSNLRSWLNSDKDNVTYSGPEPNAQAMSEQANGYNTEAGFLSGFTPNEISAILPTEITTNSVVTEDLVYLLSSEELTWLEEADVSKYAIPTQQARELDTSKWYELQITEYGVSDHYWWLRDNNGLTGSGVNVMSYSYAGGSIISEPAGLEGYGVRPVMTLDITADSTVMLNYIGQELYNEIIDP